MTKITDNNGGKMHPQINNNDHVVWQGKEGSDSNWEIFLWDGTGITNISNNPEWDGEP